MPSAHRCSYPLVTPFADKCFKKVFEKMPHGWSLRSDMSDPEQGPQANEAIKLAIQFFKDNL
jgi:hypothetical protein